MKFKQDETAFKPITVTIENRAEAEAIVALARRAEEAGYYDSKEEHEVLIEISKMSRYIRS